MKRRLLALLLLVAMVLTTIPAAAIAQPLDTPVIAAQPLSNAADFVWTVVDQEIPIGTQYVDVRVEISPPTTGVNFVQAHLRWDARFLQPPTNRSAANIFPNTVMVDDGGFGRPQPWSFDAPDETAELLTMQWNFSVQPNTNETYILVRFAVRPQPYATVGTRAFVSIDRPPGVNNYLGPGGTPDVVAGRGYVEIIDLNPMPMTFDANVAGALPRLQPVTAFAGQTVQWGTMRTDPRVVTPLHPNGYRLLGWSRLPNNNPAGIITDTTLWTVAEATANPVVYAVWGEVEVPPPTPVPMNFMGNGGAPNQPVTAFIRSTSTFGTLDTNPPVVTPVHPNRYEFLGWSFTQNTPAPNGGSAVLIPSTQSWVGALIDGSRYRTVWAVWCTDGDVPPPPYITFAFDSNGGQQPAQSIRASLQANEINYVLDTRPVPPTREHFNFAGWWTQQTGGESLETVETRGITFADPWPRIFYARWTPIGQEFGMTFSGNGGTPAIQPVVAFVGPGVQFGTMTTNPTVMRPSHPERRAFLGWSRLSDNNEASIIADTTLWTLAEATANPVVFAVWGPPGSCPGTPMDMTFMGNGGTPLQQNVTVTIYANTVFGDFARPPLLDIMYRPHHEFLGWSAIPGGPQIDENTPWNATSSPNRVYARWQIRTIPYEYPTPVAFSFVANNGTPSHQTILADHIPNTSNYYPRTQPTNPTRTHNNFGGWFSTCGLEFVPGTNQVLAYRGPRVFYARWNPIGQNVAMTFDGNVGLPAIQAVTAFVGPGVLFGEMIFDGTNPLLVNPQHPQLYRFLGWSRSADNNPAGIIADNTVWDVAQATANPTLFAVWCTDYEDGVRVQMNFRGNNGTPVNQEVTALVNITTTFGDILRNVNPPVTRPFRADHTFLGWSRTAAPGSPIIADSELWAAAMTNAAYRTVYAQWQFGGTPPYYPLNITFAFTGNGGAFAGGAVHQSVLATRIGAGPNYTLSAPGVNPERLHYTFLGWNTQADGLGTAFTDFTGANPITYYNPVPRVFYAIWSSNTEPMAMWFVGNGGSPVDQLVVARVGPGVTFGTLRTDPRVVTPFRDGFHFTGWSLTPDGAVIDPTTVWDNQSPNRVYAQWAPGGTPPRVQMNFMGNGGTPNQEVMVIIAANSTFGTLDTDPVVVRPSRAGHRFIGWSRLPFVGSAIIGDNEPWDVLPLANRTVHAQWEPGPEDYPDYIPVAFHAPDADEPQYRRQAALAELPGTFFGALDAVPTAPYRHGFTFRGWYTAPVGGTRLVEGRAVAYRERSFYAQWDSNAHPMWFVGNGGDPANQVVTVLLGTASTFGNLDANPRVVRPVHPEGYRFLGWSLIPGGPVVDPSTPWSDASPQVVYARWGTVPNDDPRHRLNMTFVNNNGTGVEQAVVALIGPGSQTFGTLDTNPVVQRPSHPGGYEFLGWSLTPAGPVNIIPDSEQWFTWSANRVYARWNTDGTQVYPDEISIAFYGAGGNPPRQLVLADLYDGATFFGSLQSTVATPIHPDDLEFLGWFTEPGGNGVKLEAGDPITYDGPRIFFAHWESFFLEFRFDGDNNDRSNLLARPFDYIRIPVTPGEPVDWDSDDGRYVRAIGNIYTTGSYLPHPGNVVEGHSFWGWFDDDALDYGQANRGFDTRRRPMVPRCISLPGSPARSELGWDIGATDFIFTEAQFETMGDGKVISFTAIFSLWGDADDNDQVNSADILLMEEWLFDRIMPTPIFSNPINLRAANVTTVGTPGTINSADVLRLEEWLFDRIMPHAIFDAILGRP